ncbi:acyltransferase family protein [Morganella morganii]|uniref:acyltransferase family protein n=1 Tax=Morganella morganii TaxID=582 RepID=UPI0034D5FC73
MTDTTNIGTVQKGRIPLFDNVKLFLIILVVLGHAADYYTSQYKEARWFFLYVYSFHMPAFIFVSGFFSKKLLTNKPFPTEKVFSLLILYVLLQLSIYGLLWFNGGSPKLSLFVVGGVPWFLLALPIWMVLLHILMPVKFSFLFPATIVAGVLVGFDPKVSQFLATSRVIVFFPFFLLGAYFRIEHVEMLRKRWVSVLSVVFIAAGIVLSWVYIDEMYKLRYIFTGQNPYSVTVFSKSVLWSIGARVFNYITAFLFIVALLAVVTNKSHSFTRLGERTLQVYFLHRLVLYEYFHLKINDHLKVLAPDYWWALYIIIFIIVSFALSASVISKPFDYIYGLKYKIIMKQ